MTKNHCHVIVIVIYKNISELVKYPKWSCYSSYISFNTLSKQQGCKEPCKIKNVTSFVKRKIFLEKQYPKLTQLCEDIR